MFYFNILKCASPVVLINLQCPTTQVSENVEIKYSPCILVMVLKNETCICLDLKIVHFLQNTTRLFYKLLVASTLSVVCDGQKNEVEMHKTVYFG